MNNQYYVTLGSLKLIFEKMIVTEIEVFNGDGDFSLDGLDLFNDVDVLSKISARFGKPIDFLGVKIFKEIGMCTSDPLADTSDEQRSYSFSGPESFNRFLSDMKLQ